MSTDQPSSNAARVGLAATAAVGLLACAHAWFAYKGYASDQAFVSFRVAERLGDGLGLSWTDGEALERHLDPLHVALLALADTLGLEPVRAARWGGYLGVLLATVSACVDPARWRLDPTRAGTGALLLATTGALGAAAMSGTEGALLAGTTGLAALATLRAARPASGPVDRVLLAWLLAAVAGLHADGWLLALGLLAGGTWATGSVRPWVAPALGPVVVLAGLTAWRVSTLGQPLPPTVPDELTGSAVALGLGWVLSALAAHAVLTGAAAVGAAREPDQALTRVVLPPVLLWLLARVVLAPLGDLWSGFVPVLALLAMLAGPALRPLTTSAGGLGLLAGLVFGHGAVSSATAGLDLARQERSEWYAPPLAHILRSAFGEEAPTLAVEQPGVLPYWTGFPTTVVAETDDLWANKPDILVFGDDLGTLEPTTPAGLALFQRPDFPEYYQPVGFTAKSKLVGRIKATVYLLREGGTLGLKRTRNEVTIPGWYAASPGSWATRWDGTTLAAPLTASHTSAVTRLLLRAGRWEVVSDDGALGVDFRCGPLSASRLRADPSPVLVLDEPGHVDIVLWSAGEQGIPLTELTVRATEREPTHRCDAIPTTPWSLLPREAQPGAPWDAPGAMRFGEEGLRVQLDGPVTAEQLVISLDGNDPYALRWYAESVPAGRTPVHPAQAGGLQPRRVAIPPRARERGADRVLVVPAGGDQSWSLGAIRLE